tara:strand:- start:5375 stop:6004 length:630 start_codon:yes stop_codon:yes gene_type:complete
MLENVPSHEQFLSDMKNHKMNVILDTDTHKHLSFSSGSFEHAFDVVAFPWHVMIVGDIGSYTFSRDSDMFRWFVKDSGKAISRPEVELGRWRQKLVSVDSHLGVVEVSLSKVLAVINGVQDNYIECYPECADCINDAFNELLQFQEDGVGMLLHVMYLFTVELNGEGHAPFSDFEREEVEVYTPQFAMCCYAINFGIGMYLESKAQVGA